MMASVGGFWNRGLEAARSASELLGELAVDQAEQIDVFGICEDLGLWLAFMPLEKLLGALVTEGTGGVMITTQRPIPVQRYTAAHEIGHWRLHRNDGMALDDESHILGKTPSEREHLAQIFAANLLMPPPLVLGVLDSLGTGTIGPSHAYSVAREAGVSYEAAVRQMHHLNILDRLAATTLLSTRPLAVKTAIAHGRRPVNGYADVWPVDENWDNEVLRIRADDEIFVSLPENRSTGYRWTFPWMAAPKTQAAAPPPVVGVPTERHSPELAVRSCAEAEAAERPRIPGAALDGLGARSDTSSHRDTALPPAAPVQVVGDQYLSARAPVIASRHVRRWRLNDLGPAADSDPGREPIAATSGKRVGATGRRLFGLRFTEPGASTIRLRYSTAYDDSSVTEEFVIHALVEARRASFAVEQVALEPEAEWVDEARQHESARVLAPLSDDDDDGLEVRQSTVHER